MKRLNFPDSDLPHVIYEPDEIPDTPLPLIVFLHGRGERGTDLKRINIWGIPKYLDVGNDIPAILYAPQCPDTSENWVSQIDKIIAGIDAIQTNYNISKTHVAGFSMGGHGTQFLAITYPERFTAIAPCATYMYPDFDITDEVCVLKDKSLWYFHSEGDFVPINHTDNVIEKLRECNTGNLKYSRYIEPDHTQTADLAFLDEEFYSWILKQ